jgi:hypothetical protein
MTAMFGREILATHFFRCYGANAQDYVERIARDLVDPNDVELAALWPPCPEW